MVRLEKGTEEKGTGREETAKRADEKGGRREEKLAKKGHLHKGDTKKVFFENRLVDEGVPSIYHR